MKRLLLERRGKKSRECNRLQIPTEDEPTLFKSYSELRANLTPSLPSISAAATHCERGMHCTQAPHSKLVKKLRFNDGVDENHGWHEKQEHGKT